MQYANYVKNSNTQVSSGSGYITDYTISNSRYATGAENLVPEESTNSSLGFNTSDNLTITYDIWEIEKENTIGLFGRVNQSIYDLLLRTRLGIGGAQILQTWKLGVEQM